MPQTSAKSVLAIFLLAGILSAQSQAANSGEVAHENAAKKDLELAVIGNGKLSDGTATAFRVYAAPDGTKGLITYMEFDSSEAARQMIEKWLKATPTITSREKNLTVAGQLVSDRILGQVEKDGKKEFVIIRRDELKCYLIESTSLQVAMKVEGQLSTISVVFSDGWPARSVCVISR